MKNTFRAWSKQDKVMCGVSMIDWENKKARIHRNLEVGEYDLKDLELMQSTGLFDKNGKEIYEGDIMSFIETDEDSCSGIEEKIVGTIEYIIKSGGFRFVEKNGRRRELYLVVGFSPVCDVKVVGDIYTTPELLTK